MSNKSLNDKKLTEIKRERTKLKRKDLTPEQIKELLLKRILKREQNANFSKRD